MLSKRVWICLFIINLFSVAVAQDKPLTSAITYEVLTDVLTVDEPQILEISITCNAAGPVKYIALNLPGVSSVMSLIAAKLNNEPLWLIQADGRRESLPNIIPWNFEKDSARLVLYPGAWEVGYRLDLEIQVNIEKVDEIQAEEAKIVRMETEIPSGIFSGSPSGRGSHIIFQ